MSPTLLCDLWGSRKLLYSLQEAVLTTGIKWEPGKAMRTKGVGSVHMDAPLPDKPETFQTTQGEISSGTDSQ